ncbi:hypothetical protein ACOSQ2_031014 [Xanthoceras sorbifolium]
MAAGCGRRHLFNIDCFEISGALARSSNNLIEGMLLGLTYMLTYSRFSTSRTNCGTTAQPCSLIILRQITLKMQKLLGISLRSGLKLMQTHTESHNTQAQ